MAAGSNRVTVYEGEVFSARRAWSALVGHGIDAKLLGEGLGSMVSGTRFVTVVVPRGDERAAREILRAMDLLSEAG